MKKSNRLVTVELQKNKCHILTIFPVLGNLTFMSNDYKLMTSDDTSCHGQLILRESPNDP